MVNDGQCCDVMFTIEAPVVIFEARCEASNNAIWVVSKSLTADIVPEVRGVWAWQPLNGS